MAALTPRKISLCSDYLYIYVYIHVYTCIHIDATYIEIHISWGRDDRRVYLFTPTPLLIPIFTEYNRGRIKICIESILLNSIHSPSLSIYIYIYFKKRKRRRRRNCSSRRIVHRDGYSKFRGILRRRWKV